MIPLKIKTKYFTLEVYRRGIVFTIASLLIASGVNLVNGNIFLAIISIFNKQVFKEDSNEYGFSVVFYHTRKVKRGYYELELQLITEAPETMKWGEITEAHTHMLEKAILEQPAYWLWSHKRWKRTIPEDLEELKHEQKLKFEERFPAASGTNKI